MRIKLEIIQYEALFCRDYDAGNLEAIIRHKFGHAMWPWTFRCFRRSDESDAFRLSIHFKHDIDTLKGCMMWMRQQSDVQK